MGSGTKERSFGLSLLLKKISCVVHILRKLETGLVSKKVVVSVIEQTIALDCRVAGRGLNLLGAGIILMVSK